MSALLLGVVLAAAAASNPGGAASAVAGPPPAAAPAWPGPRSATATAEQTEVRLGQPFTLVIEVRHDKGEHWRLKGGEKLDPFKLRAQAQTDQSGSDADTTRINVELALFALGAHAVPDLTLVAEKGGAPPHEFNLPGPLVKGTPAPGSDKEKRDIRGPVPLRVTSWQVLYWALGGVALAVAIALAIRAWRRRPRREKHLRVVPVPEDRTALEGLSMLEAEGLPGCGEFKVFHLRLSGILRRYLSDRYGILALDMTSEELYHSLARLPSEGLSLADLAWVNAQGDLAKFAKGTPTVDDCRQALQLVRQLVVRTRRLPQSPSAELAPKRVSA